MLWSIGASEFMNFKNKINEHDINFHKQVDSG